jgi:hypothetical protein
LAYAVREGDWKPENLKASYRDLGKVRDESSEANKAQTMGKATEAKYYM